MEYTKKNDRTENSKFIDSWGQPTFNANSDHCFCTCCLWVRPYVSPCFSKQNKCQTKNNVHYWRDCGSGWVDHWWYLYCLVLFLSKLEFLLFFAQSEKITKLNIDKKTKCNISFHEKNSNFLSGHSSMDIVRYNIFINDKNLTT